MNGIIGTAGHIDHGKTALIGALTGEATDRLPEEQRRGISIDLGFSHIDTDGGRLGIVDVPGHEDFIRNMLAGATGIDILLLVVAADEGVMPQTREHTAIAELLGVRRAVVALTKVDLVDDDWLGLVHDDLADFLAATPFAGAPVVATSAETGEGLDELRTTLERVFDGARGDPEDLFRLPVDRVFTVRGTGTVVTGTVWSGRLEREAAVRLLPDGPVARVRSLQVHGREVETVAAGERAALALAGTDRAGVERGMVVVSDEAWQPSHILTARLRVLEGPGWSVEDRQRVRVHLGTAEVMARAVLLDRDRPLAPGDEGWAQLRLEAPLVARTGDRLVIRSYSPVTTIGGGQVAEPVAPKRSRLAEAERDLLAAVLSGTPDEALAATLMDAHTRGVPRSSLPVRLGHAPAALEAGVAAGVLIAGRAYGRAALAEVRTSLLRAVEAYHQGHHLERGMDPEQLRQSPAGAEPALVQRALDDLLEEGALEMRAGRVARSGWSPTLSPEERAVQERIRARIAAAGPAPPRLEEIAAELGPDSPVPELVALLEDEGQLVQLEHDLFIDADTIARLVESVRRDLGGREGLAPTDFRAVADVSRRHLMPLLAYLDRQGVTVRSGEGRTVTRA